ncbi:hypothetical protein NE237_020269 [Protea cynaroides]|uniref:Copine C-terminal domain-containing protein n=1 Tax=Protea cynaroides TaxID=273540 RepID=A0A9Q0H6X3_9MAGN|nr:hypothetical protein NE237_020269 [Protea cynaroides]
MLKLAEMELIGSGVSSALPHEQRVDRRSLHAFGSIPNPYEQAISITGRTLSPFDEDNWIPCFGFGDATTHDKYVFSFFADHRPCHGFVEALARYREIVPYLKLAGPTSFAPIINASIDIVEKSHGQYHVLVIIADGQVSRSDDLPPGRFSPQEQATIDSIVEARDGPWDAKKQFDDNIPQRSFDNFQTCKDCGVGISLCPMCHEPITTRLRLYS